MPFHQAFCCSTIIAARGCVSKGIDRMKILAINDTVHKDTTITTTSGSLPLIPSVAALQLLLPQANNLFGPIISIIGSPQYLIKYRYSSVRNW